MSEISTPLLQGLQIVWINILLSGDNAVVIALACRRLETRQRLLAVFWGAFAAVALRILLTVFIVTLERLPYIRMVCGVLLMWIAFSLPRDQDDTDIAEATSIWSAVRTIVIADAIMSIDNVVAVAAAAKNSLPLIVFGIAASVPIIVFGSSLVLKLLRRFPILVVAGAALLGWIAGEIFVSDTQLAALLGPLPERIDLIGPAIGAGLVLLATAIMRAMRWHQRGRRPETRRPETK